MYFLMSLYPSTFGEIFLYLILVYNPEKKEIIVLQIHYGENFTFCSSFFLLIFTHLHMISQWAKPAQSQKNNVRTTFNFADFEQVFAHWET